MPAPERFELVAPLPSPRRHLHVAVDRGSGPPRAVVLAFYPRAVSDDPGRLGRLAGEIERAARLFHPNLLAPVGIEAVGDDLAAVTIWRDAVTLREVLDAGGRLPPDVAARVAADVCAGLAHAHGRPEAVVHGLLRPEAVLLDEGGAAALSGFGMPGGSGVPDDLLGVGDLLHECLLGEPPEAPSLPPEAAGVPAPLAAVVNRARAADPAARFPSAEALAAAIAEAVPLAPREAVAAYVEVMVPARSGPRAERRARIEAALAGPRAHAQPEEISEHDIVGAATPLPGDVARAPVPLSPALSPATRTPTPTAPFPAPRAPAVPHRRGGFPLAVALAMCAGGIAVGFALARLVPADGGAAPASGASPEARAPASPGDEPLAPARRSSSSAPGRRSSSAAPERRRAAVRRLETRAYEREAGTALLDVTAPEGAEVWLDGRRVGTGSTRRQIPEGDHRIEVRYRGAKVAERFHVAPRETWTYAVTPDAR